MQDNYGKIVTANLDKVFSDNSRNLFLNLPAEKSGAGFVFRAFGEEGKISPAGIYFGSTLQNSVLGILVSLYALNTTSELCITEPFRAFKELPDSMPYAGAFITHTQQVLVPHVETLESKIDLISAAFNGGRAELATGGDFSFRLQPLPKIWLEFICYLPDEDFPAAVTCLYSQNADRFLTTDALADVGEYTVKKMITLLLSGNCSVKENEQRNDDTGRE